MTTKKTFPVIQSYLFFIPVMIWFPPHISCLLYPFCDQTTCFRSHKCFSKIKSYQPQTVLILSNPPGVVNAVDQWFLPRTFSPWPPMWLLDPEAFLFPSLPVSFMAYSLSCQDSIWKYFPKYRPASPIAWRGTFQDSYLYNSTFQLIYIN